MTLKDLQERVKQQVYTKPFDLDDAKECWKVAKKAMDKMISIAVEQGRMEMKEEIDIIIANRDEIWKKAILESKSKIDDSFKKTEEILNYK